MATINVSAPYTQVEVQAAITTAVSGDIVITQSGTWTSGITCNKYVKLKGLGGGRCEGGSKTSLTIGTGSKSFTIYSGTNGSGQVCPAYVNGFTVGETLTANYIADGTKSMTGTVTSWNSSTLVLVLNITSTSGSGTFAGWTMTAPATTVITANHGAGVLIALTESTVGSLELSDLCITAGTGTGKQITTAAVASGKAILIHDVWSHDTATAARTRFLTAGSLQGVCWNCYLDTGFTLAGGAPHPGYGFEITRADATGAASWSTISKWGDTDTTGLSSFYIENCYFAGCLSESHDWEDNARVVLRYCVYDNSGGTSHGADTSNYGMRSAELYNNCFMYSELGADNPSLAYGLLCRGGSWLITDNVMPACTNTSYPNKPSVDLEIYQLRRNAGPHACWFDAGVDSYPAPRQVGMGRVTGASTSDSFAYNGDSEPCYQWNNTGTGSYASPNIGTWSPNECAGTAGVSATYIQVGRDYINGAKPGYTKYTYPSPLRPSVASLGGITVNGALTLQGKLTLQ